MTNTYNLNDIYTSRQGEGAQVGRPVIFVRLAKCNFACAFCDTEFDSVKLELDVNGLFNLISAESYNTGCKSVLFTGGEPTLYDLVPITEKLKEAGFWVGLESNGSNSLAGLEIMNHITISPKSPNSVHIDTVFADEVRLVVPQPWITPEWIISFDKKIMSIHRYLSPMEIDGDFTKGIEAMYSLKEALIGKTDQHWNMSLQTHKLVWIK